MAFDLSILTPEGAIYQGEASSITAEGVQGNFGVLSGHAPMISALNAGPVKVDTGTETLFFAVGDGVLEVANNSVKVLADNAEKAESLDEAKSLSKELGERLKAFE